MSELRHRKPDGGQPSSKAHSAAPSTLDDGDDVDDAPLVSPATSAYASVADVDVSAGGALAGPISQSMDEGDESATTAAPQQPANNGSQLNLPPQLRSAFERRKAELLAKYPDLLVSFS
jgi:hypothetical protein